MFKKECCQSYVNSSEKWEEKRTKHFQLILQVAIMLIPKPGRKYKPTLGVHMQEKNIM